ncbi:MAG: SDR family NAD(P)-dependent oxidoreductase [Gemmatimonadales bacterium]
MAVDRPLQHRTAVVTGGGRGIGADVARALTTAGCRVVVTARTQSQLDGLVEELRCAGHDAWAVRCDVSDQTSVTEMARAAYSYLDHIDILVNNAGIASSAPLRTQTLEEWNRLMAINATGTFLCTQAFLPKMLTRGWGRVVNIASVAGVTGAKYIAAYSASKHAVVGFTRSVAAEVTDHDVTVNAICPGYVDTDMTRQSIERITSKTGMSPDDALATILDTSPQHRLIAPDEVAGLVLWLCSSQAKGVNGQAIVMDGGGLLA